MGELMSNDKKSAMPKGRISGAGNDNLRAELTLDPRLEGRKDVLVSPAACAEGKGRLEDYLSAVRRLETFPGLLDDIPVGGASVATLAGGLEDIVTAPAVISGAAAAETIAGDAVRAEETEAQEIDASRIDAAQHDATLADADGIDDPALPETAEAGSADLDIPAIEEAFRAPASDEVAVAGDEVDPFLDVTFARVDEDTLAADLDTGDVAVNLADPADDGTDETRFHSDTAWHEEMLEGPEDDDDGAPVAEAAAELEAGTGAETEADARIEDDVAPDTEGHADFADYDQADIEDILAGLGAEPEPKPEPLTVAEDDAEPDFAWDMPRDVPEAAADAEAGNDAMADSAAGDGIAYEDTPSAGEDFPGDVADDFPGSMEVEAAAVMDGGDEEDWLKNIMTESDPTSEAPAAAVGDDFPEFAQEDLPASDEGNTIGADTVGDDGWSDPVFDEPEGAAEAEEPAMAPAEEQAPAPKKGFLARLIPGGKKKQAPAPAAEDASEPVTESDTDAFAGFGADPEPKPVSPDMAGDDASDAAADTAAEEAAPVKKKSQLPLLAASVAALALAGGGAYVYMNPGLIGGGKVQTAAATPSGDTGRIVPETSTPKTPPASDVAAAAPAEPGPAGDPAQVAGATPGPMAGDDGFGTGLESGNAGGIEDMFLRDEPVDPAAAPAIPVDKPDPAEVARQAAFDDLKKEVAGLTARLDAVDEAFDARDAGTVQRDAMLTEAMETATRAETLAKAQNQILVEVIRTQDKVAVAEQLIVDLSRRVAAVEMNDPADRMTVERTVKDLNQRVEGLARDVGLVARMTINGRTGTGAGTLPRGQSTAGTVVPGSAMVFEQGQSTMTHPTASPSNVHADVKVGDLVEGYGKVLDVMGTSDGGKLVIMEHGSVIIPD